MNRYLKVAAVVVFAICAIPLALLLWFRALGNGPIRFYGRVVDPNGRGLPGITVKAEVTQADRPSSFYWYDERVSDLPMTTTDSDGRFSFDADGVILTIKEIYSPDWVLWNGTGGAAAGFNYHSRGRPPGQLFDKPANPCVYHMVPAGSAEAKWDVNRVNRSSAMRPATSQISPLRNER